MEPITRPLEEVVNQLDSTISSIVSKTILHLEPDERNVLELKYKSQQLGKMTFSDRTKWTKALILKISVITGWVVPNGYAINILVDQLEKKLFETYPNVNPDEVEFAFREKGTGFKDWGKEMNLALIDDVMLPYMDRRYQVSLKEEQIKNKFLALPVADNKAVKRETILDQNLWDQTSELVTKTRYSAILVPSFLYDWAAETGKINLTGEQKMEYKIRAEVVRYTDVVNDYEDDPHNIVKKQTLDNYNKMREEKYYSKVENDKIIDLAKRLIIFDTMKKEAVNE
jgi:hypothetical protein